LKISKFDIIRPKISVKNSNRYLGLKSVYFFSKCEILIENLYCLIYINNSENLVILKFPKKMPKKF